MESLVSVLEAMGAEKETEPSIHAPEVITPKKDIEPLFLFRMLLPLGHENTVVPTVEYVITILERSVGPIFEDPLTGESATTKAEADIPSASPEMTALLLRWTSRRSKSLFHLWSRPSFHLFLTSQKAGIDCNSSFLLFICNPSDLIVS